MKKRPIKKTVSFSFFPENRMYSDFPWQIWTAGWFLILKAIVWLSLNPAVSDVILKVMGYKYLLCTIPLIILGIGVWNLKRWAAWGTIILCITELIFFIVYPTSLKSLQLNHDSSITLIISFMLFVINGPVSDLIILSAIPVTFKYTKRSGQGLGQK